MALVNIASPLLVIHLYESSLTSLLDGIPFVPVDIKNAVGFTIPIPLAFASGTDLGNSIIVDGVDNAIAISNDNQQAKSDTGSKSKVKQKLMNASFGIHGRYKSDSILMQVVVSALKILLSRIVDMNYAISFFYGSNIILFARLQSFATDSDFNTNMINFNITLSTMPEGESDTVQTSQTITQVEKVTGVLP